MHAAIKILLIGKGMNGSSRLRNHLVKHDCEIESVWSIDRGLALLQDDSFDLVLAPISMEPGKRSNLIEDLLNSTSHLFFSLSVEDGSWWIPCRAKTARTRSGIGCDSLARFFAYSR